MVSETPMIKEYSMVPLMLAAEGRSLEGNPSCIGAFNVNFRAQSDGIFEGASRVGAPFIIQVSRGARNFQGGVENISNMIRESARGSDNLYSIHLDHGDVEGCIGCVTGGFGGVMIDVSERGDMENIAITNEIVKSAHKRGISVESEYGELAGVEEDIMRQMTVYANPMSVPVFFGRSGCDALAIAYGTSHGANKGNTEALNVEIVKQSYGALRNFGMNKNCFLVSHGSSTVPEELIALVNKYGGTLKGAKGVPEPVLKKVIEYGIRKVNIDTDLRLGITGETRKFFHERKGVEGSSVPLGLIHKVLFEDGVKSEKRVVNPGDIIDPRDYLKPVMALDGGLLREDYTQFEDGDFAELMDKIKQRVAGHVEHLCRDVFGSEGLVERVDRSLTLEEMAKRYAKDSVF